ncbi:3-methyladenine DNA glycosylase [compost metagenome]
MMERRGMSVLKPNITAGPGALAKAMGIGRLLNAKDLTGEEIWIEEAISGWQSAEIVAGPRIGVDYAADHALLPWRYYLKGNRYVSKPNS